MADDMRLNFFAPLEGLLGYPIHARNFAMAMERAGVEITFIPIYGVGQFKAVEEEVKAMVIRANQGIDYSAPAIKLSIGSPPEMAMFHGEPRIGYTLLETSRIMPDWVASLNQLDQVWTPSRWGAGVFEDSGVDPDLIRVVPEGVNTDVFKPGLEPMGELENVGKFRFLSIGKMENRKGQDILLRAFSEEFRKEEDVFLVMQSFSPFLPNFNIWKFMYDLNMRENPNLLFLGGYTDTIEALASLYSAADCFVTPTRGEGWGLPVLEAMACGLPVIATHVTGITEYASKNNIYALKHRGLVPVDDPVFFAHTQGSDWYEPDAEHLKQLMRYVFDNQDEARKMGDRAARRAKKFTWDNAAGVAIKTLRGAGAFD